MYIPANGLMLENQEDFEAVAVFAEHRYFGSSIPSQSLKFFTVEQCMEDYAFLIELLQTKYSQNKRLPLIAFGGSYG